MDRRCSTHGEMRNVGLILVVNYEEKLEECIIKIGLKLEGRELD